MDTNTLQRELDEHLAKARDIAGRAERETRQFTSSEKSIVEESMAKARQLKARIKNLNSDNEMLAAMAEFGADIGLDYSVTRAKQRSAWARSVIEASSTASGFKGLLPSGTAPVTVPLAPDATRLHDRTQFVRQLLTANPAGVDPFSYLKQVKRDNNAAPVERGTLKPTSEYGLVRVDDRCRTIAHLSEPIPRQDLSDADLLARFIDAEMRLGIELAIDGQIVSGDGSGENLTGILETSGIQYQPFDTDVFVTARKAVTKLEVAEVIPSAWIMSPSDWETFELAEDGEERFKMDSAGQPIDRAARRLWGVPVSVTSAARDGNPILGDFTGSAELWVREEARLDWSETVSDNFEKNLVTFRCEARIGFGVTRPLGFVSTMLDEES